MTEYLPRRGDHLYVWRKVRMYQHHGIVVTKDDIIEKVSLELTPNRIEDLMVVEQNIHGLGIVTLKDFRTEHPFNYEHDIGCAQYKTDPMDYYLNRSGTCYLTKRLSEDQIVDNAIRIYNDERQREIWKTYSLILKNCEQFAFICSTSVELVLGEQVLMGCNVVKCVFVNSMYNAVKYIFQMMRDLARQFVSGVPIETIIKANGLAALTAFMLEALILSIRLFVYYYYEEDRSKNLVRRCAIRPEDYAQQMIQAGFGSLAAFGMSIAGIGISSTFFVSSMAPMVCSIFFGFLGYIAARWITGLIVLKVRKTLSVDNDDDDDDDRTCKKAQVVFRNRPGDDDDTVELIQ